MENNEQDKAAITSVLEDYYFKGIYEGNIELLSGIFHPGTLLFGDVKGQPYAKTLEVYLDGVANRQSPKDFGKPFKGDIIDIRTVNSIAVAEVKVKMYDFNYHELLSFHRIDGKWLIVNKMISDIEIDTTNNKENKITLIANIDILPGFETDVKKALITMAIESRKDAGCELFQINTRDDSPRLIAIYEIYQSDETFQLHKATPHAQAFFEYLKGKIKDDKIDIVFLKEIDN